MNASPTAARPWTFAGLAIALFGAPAVVILFKQAEFTRADFGATIVRELIILALVAILVWIIRTREKLPLSSIGLRPQKIVPALLWSLAVMLVFGVGIAACLAIFPLIGLSYGSSSGPAVPIGVSLLLYARAGIAEEIFYRGYAIERIEALTGSRAIAAAVPLLIFAGGHFSQGLPGILITFVLGGIATAIYLWKRNLLILIIAHFMVDFIPNVLLPLIFGS
ncbi:type II CAAX endopeptidase family protein [Sphingomonas sp.]|uniref:CPBP family intramembrane glutamic endopeptidase n=1 Tax=Sphingomonas sp. TaxID=28214 RepID=UPI0025DE282E|nr:type II CAAX endopeptidase family protein [Sphingomonas sp.]